MFVLKHNQNHVAVQVCTRACARMCVHSCLPSLSIFWGCAAQYSVQWSSPSHSARCAHFVVCIDIALLSRHDSDAYACLHRSGVQQGRLEAIQRALSVLLGDKDGMCCGKIHALNTSTPEQQMIGRGVCMPFPSALKDGLLYVACRVCNLIVRVPFTEFTQECASNGLGLVYQCGSDDMKKVRLLSSFSLFFLFVPILWFCLLFLARRWCLAPVLSAFPGLPTTCFVFGTMRMR